MPRASTKATLDVRPGREIYSNWHKQVGTGALKSTAPKIIARTPIALMNTALKNTAPKNTALTSITLKNTDRTTRGRETASVRRKEGIESSLQRVPRICWTT